MHILIVEDDTDTSRNLALDLAAFGHTTSVARDGRDAIFIATEDRFDAMIVDRMLPLIDGIEVIRRVRDSGIAVPVIMLTALGDLVHRVEGLKGGADDYLVKPVDPIELNARVQAAVRRATGAVFPGTIQIGDVRLNLLQHSVEFRGDMISLRPIEFRILKELMANRDRVITKAMLLERVWGYYFSPESNIVELHIHKLRSHLKNHGLTDFISTVRGSGYLICDR